MVNLGKKLFSSFMLGELAAFIELVFILEIAKYFSRKIFR